jgi:hypothetical protein
VSEKFRRIGTADIGCLEVWVRGGKACLDNHSGNDPTRALLGLEDARALRDWLNDALPCEHKGIRDILAGGADTDIITGIRCRDCGEQLPLPSSAPFKPTGEQT